MHANAKQRRYFNKQDVKSAVAVKVDHTAYVVKMYGILADRYLE